MSFEVVVNISEGKDWHFINLLSNELKPALLDLHYDEIHNRSVVTLIEDHSLIYLKKLVDLVFSHLDISVHEGVHPRLGVLDVVPFVPLPVSKDASLEEVIQIRDEFGSYLATNYQVPVFLYGPEISLPEVRRRAFKDLEPNFGPPKPHPRWGAACVGARNVLVAYNLMTKRISLQQSNEFIKTLRNERVRCLVFDFKSHLQFSFNLIDPFVVGPLEIYEKVQGFVEVLKAELVGLIPLEVIKKIPEDLWEKLDVSVDKTIEYRISHLSKGLTINDNYN